MVRDQVAIGVLAIAWQKPVAGVSLRLSALIDLLGAEAAVAIGRADLLGQLEHLARTDSLTGLPNRRYWEQQLPRELSRASRDAQGMCVAMLDLDHFKRFNDDHGHPAGDALLVDAAALWREAIRPTDALARHGGEEFALAMPDTELDQALEIVDRLRAATPRGQRCSAGITCWDGSETAASLLARADVLLYEAKTGGRDRSVALV